MPASSPLKTSFLDLSLSSHASPPKALVKFPHPILPSTVSPPTLRTEDIPARSTSSTRPRKSHTENFLIPAFQHPNSPYVPWTPPVRRRIICPHSVASVSADSHYSRPFSRSGARAPEPTATPEPSAFAGSGKVWKLFKQTISKRVGRAVNRIGRSKSLSSSQRPAPYLPAITTSVAHHITISDDGDFFSAHHSSPPPLATPAQYMISPSLASLASSDSTTLERWLADRKDNEEDSQSGSVMSIADYEARGSWLNLVGEGSISGNWSCGVPGCEVHARNQKILEGQVTTLDFSPMAESLDGHTSLPTTPHRHLSSPSVGTPRASQVGKGSTPRALRGASSVDSGSPRRRETSMPGGWTFSF
ncbi:hypothetical protein HWV62_19843 [Athelia sp. TMB]|nr:hypothetical protein HWV62_19843 [Athelia sp. TMB]